MSSSTQIAANRQNAQASTGPKTDEGKHRSSLNATRHGFTGQMLILSPEEKEAYEFHCLAFLEQYQPANHVESDLIQQYTDLRWTLHQISVQQSNLLTLINAITTKLMQSGDLDDINATLAPHYKSLNTLGTYEQRRRRAADATIARFQELAEARRQQLAEAAKLYKAAKTQNQPFAPADFGFVCSMAQIEKHLERANRIAEVKKLSSAATL